MVNPIFKSPNDDNGYDISDYCDIIIEIIIFGKKKMREMFQIIGQAAFKAQLGNLMKRQMSIICIYFLKNNLI